METYIVLLRGVNVGGRNILPMKELKTLLLGNGFEAVQTYIQSGNVVIRSSENPEKAIAELIQTNFRFTAEVLVLSKAEFDASVTQNPYQEYEGKFVHFYYCQQLPDIDYAKLESLISKTERYTLIGNVFYLHAPEGIGRSKLVAGIEKCLGVAATGRNLNTITKLSEMLASL